jgi:hypothetical protein
VAESLGPGEGGGFGLRHAFEEIEAAIVFGDVLGAEIMAPVSLGPALRRRVAAFEVTSLVIADTSLARALTRDLVGRRVHPYIGELDTVGEWIAIGHDPG